MTKEERKELSELSYELGKEIRQKIDCRYSKMKARKYLIKLTEYVALNQRHKIFRMIALLAAYSGTTVPKQLIDSYEDDEYFAITSRAFLTGLTQEPETDA